MDANGHLVRCCATRHHRAVGGHRFFHQAGPLCHPLADRAELRPGVEYGHAGHTVQLKRHQQPVAPRSDPVDPQIALVPRRHRIRAAAPGLIEGHPTPGHVEINVEREQDVGAQQTIR